MLLAQFAGNGIRTCVQGLEIEHADSTVSPFVTVSVGVAHLSSPNAADGDRLFRLADAALYKAKSRRNVTVVAEDVFDGIPVVATPGGAAARGART